MLMAVWNAHYETGIDAIDAQHRHLFDVINRLAAWFKNGHAEAGARGALQFLGDYTREHFEVEEAFMRDVATPCSPSTKPSTRPC